ncbi:hypothetical protein LT18_00616 [Pseudomonas aeruginosa]|nr:hypothetical protein LT18_00616 [Pseudomonas aeruginosa]
MRIKFLLCVLFLLISSARADEHAALQLSGLNSNGQLFCASVMLYFNPQDRAPDPRLLNSLSNYLWTMQTGVSLLGEPAELAKPFQSVQQLFNQLNGLPPEQKKNYPDLVRQLLIHVRDLQQAADLAYSREQQGLQPGSFTALLTGQSRALARLLFDYQLRHYPMVDKEQFLMSPEQLQTLDQRIEERFDQLRHMDAEHSAALDKIRSNFNFVRSQLQLGKLHAKGGAEFYVSRAVIDLDELARTVVVSQN